MSICKVYPDEKQYICIKVYHYYFADFTEIVPNVSSTDPTISNRLLTH